MSRNPRGSPELLAQIKVRGRERNFKSIVDTGTTTSIISNRTIIEFDLNTVPIKPISTRVIGTILSIRSLVIFPLCLRRRQIIIEALVAPGVPRILGMTTMKRYGMNVLVIRDAFKIGDLKIPIM